jgi:hypothetical protein
MTHIPTISESPPKDSDPDDSRENSFFRLHNCYRCDNGNFRCSNGNPHQCDYPQARND